MTGPLLPPDPLVEGHRLQAQVQDAIADPRITSPFTDDFDSDHDSEGLSDEDLFDQDLAPEIPKLAQTQFYDNLAEVLDESVLNTLSSEYLDLIEKDKEARKKRDEKYEEGLKRTGMSNEAPGGAEFAGASRVVHPIMVEGCIDFAARSIKELCPPDGPVRTKIIPQAIKERRDKADRKQRHMNWQMTVQSREFRAELEQLLSQLPLGGSQYLKTWWSEAEGRIQFEFIPIDDIFLPYSTTNFYTGSRATHHLKLTRVQFEDRIDSGMYRDVDILDAVNDIDETRSSVVSDKIEGRRLTGFNEDGQRAIFETYAYLDLKDPAAQKRTRAPYILSIDVTTRKVLSIYRNWSQNDQHIKRLDWIVEFVFVPWRGAYGIGLPHLIGGLAAASTGALRALLDSGHINNAPTLLKLKGARMGGQNVQSQPTQITEIEGAAGTTDPDVRKLAMPYPFNPPSAVLFNLLQYCVDQASGVVGTAEEKIADATNNGPVGTTQALIEQGSITYSSIHARLHQAIARVLEIVHRLNSEFLDDEVTIQELGDLIVTRQDYQGPMDVVPVSDPNIFSETQRYAQNQALLALASQAPPGMYDLKAVHKRVLETMKVPNSEELIPEPPPPIPMDPVSETMLLVGGQRVQAFAGQDHMAHILVHMEFLHNPLLGSSPMLQPQFAPACLIHVQQHLVQLWEDMITSLVGVPIPKLQQLIQDKQLPPQVEQQLAQKFAQAAGQVDQFFQKHLGSLIQQIQQFDQQLKAQQPQTPVDSGQATLQAAAAETQRLAQKDQAEMALKTRDQELETIKDQHDYEIAKAKIQVDMAKEHLNTAAKVHQTHTKGVTDSAKVKVDHHNNQTGHKVEVHKNSIDAMIKAAQQVDPTERAKLRNRTLGDQ